MKCPCCESDEVKVLDTRAHPEGLARRRRCLSCGVTYKTLETVIKIMREREKPGRKPARSDALNWDSLDIWNRNEITAPGEVGARPDDPATD